jgi:uncharacterized membrane protein
MNNHLFPRLGTFFILIGFGLLILFIGSILAKEINILYLFFAVAALFIGSILHRAAPRPEPTRFSSIRKVHQRSIQRREEKQSEEDQNK